MPQVNNIGAELKLKSVCFFLILNHIFPLHRPTS